ncbi:3'(2'),5'-bisphosphate nucleotidase CysQ [Buchnera aphidicola]|uniref:3'(2'),5'-bisphosphate nucleotidase CysQ n=1 Tax=Buchnera aphidicola (Lipaphis pseudobrassicae) TaxID=1258543 RepID=A0A4D6Y811_9GAMM|nr:3'(2'),5'-bisphosphate nucleotidase CysQ [Buchnera aphidicola]QCI22384.1 3'(2'),5'-bisphosphate nucleotidase [Buchnera aphidicola (Lipaphis pseudobrassicae)]
MLEKICNLARHTGSMIMTFYTSKKLIRISYKSDDTPVTNVDHEANNIIKKGLVLIEPNFPIISEEELYDFSVYRTCKDYWLIDPLDGTKEFLKKNGEFTVNISLIRNSVPVLGVIYAPALNILYSAFNENAWKETKLGVKEKINVSKSNRKIPLLITSRSHPDKELNNYLKKIKHYELKNMGSSLKFCLIAEGVAQIYPRFGETYIWDTAAGQAIVTAAGGRVETWTGDNLNYSLSSCSSLLNPGFCAHA